MEDTPGTEAFGIRETEVAVIGAGPLGIETAALLKRNRVPCLQFERGALGRTITRWPRHTRFFSSPERDSLAGIPLQTENQDMVSGDTYLSYMRMVVETLDLDIRLYEEITRISRIEGGFILRSRSRTGEHQLRARYIVLATGNMEFPRLIRVPGEDLPHVSHYPSDPHLYFRRNLLIVGGRNSAVETALRCFRAGSTVTISYRREAFNRKHVYSRNYLEVNLLIRKGMIRFLGNTAVTKIDPDRVTFARTDNSCRIIPFSSAALFSEPFDEVLLCTGYASDFSLFRQTGIDLGTEGILPSYNPETMETNVPGIFIAGTAAGGDSDEHGFFIGTAHGHAPRILKAIAGIEDTGTGTIPARKYSIVPEDIETD